MRTKKWQAVTIVILGVLAVPAAVWTQQEQAPLSKKEQAPSPLNRITIEITGGEANKPVENASVYVKTIEQHLIKDKKFEVNVRTNQQGVAHVPDAPMGRVLVQVGAEAWKTYAHWYDITETKQVIKIHLERPPKWY